MGICLALQEQEIVDKKTDRWMDAHNSSEQVCMLVSLLAGEHRIHKVEGDAGE